MQPFRPFDPSASTMHSNRSAVTIDGAESDLHLRVVGETVAFCGVYVRPQAPVAGYWYFPINDAAVALARRFKVLS